MSVIDNVIDKFKKLGYELDEDFTNENKIYFENDKIIPHQILIIEPQSVVKESVRLNYLDKDWHMVYEPLPITLEELQLINRLLKLWGVEV